MSVHTLIKAKITDGGDLAALLTASGISWKNTELYEKQYPFRRYHRAIEIVVDREHIWIAQFRPNTPFVFYSENARFATKQNQRAVAQLASIGADADWTKIRADAVRVKAEEKAKREEAARIARQKKEERQARAAAAMREKQLADAREKAMAAEEAREREAKAKEAEEIRQRALDAEAASIVAALNTDNLPDKSLYAPEHVGDPGAESDTPAAALEELVNKLSRANARAKVLAAADDLQRNFGLYIYSETVLEDQTIEITLRN